jgi:hypothetical protein
MRRTTAKEFEAVLKLDAPKRLQHFIKRVADEGVAWALWNDGWALMTTDDNEHSVFPLWPAREYAEACAVGDWAEYSAEEIPVNDLLGELLPKLAQRHVLPGIFPTPQGRGVTTTVDEVDCALSAEMAKYGE